MSPVSVLPGPISVKSMASALGTQSVSDASAAMLRIVSVHFTGPVSWASRFCFIICSEILIDRALGGIHLDLGDSLRQFSPRRFHERGVERTADLKHNCPFRSGGLQPFAGFFHSSHVTGNHGLPVTVVVGSHYSSIPGLRSFAYCRA